MALHITKVAFGNPTVEHLAARLELRGAAGPVVITTRYLPKRHEEIIAGGSLYWIIKHQLVARSPILGLGDTEGGRTAIHIDPALVLVEARPKRAHQGWRYLEATDAPADLGSGGSGLAGLPPALIGKLAELALI